MRAVKWRSGIDAGLEYFKKRKGSKEVETIWRSFVIMSKGIERWGGS